MSCWIQCSNLIPISLMGKRASTYSLMYTMSVISIVLMSGYTWPFRTRGFQLFVLATHWDHWNPACWRIAQHEAILCIWTNRLCTW
jgi:hypothetical protein